MANQFKEDKIAIIANYVGELCNQLDIEPRFVGDQTGLNSINYQLRKTISSGYHMIGGLGLAGSSTSVIDCGFQLKHLKDIYVVSSAALNHYPSSNIEAPIVGLAASIVKNSLEG